jgi:uncharacterized protein (TIGR02145 family)
MKKNSSSSKIASFPNGIYSFVAFHRAFHRVNSTPSSTSTSILTLALALFLSSCADLEHTNPYDRETVIPAPSNLSAQAIDDQSIQLTWTDNCTFEEGYRLERDSGSGFVQIAELEENANEYIDSGLIYGNSYQYRVRAFTTYNISAHSNDVVPIWTVTDIDGNVYRTVKIGNQIWLAENLKVKKYRDGTEIPNAIDNYQWPGQSSGAWCYYNNDSGNGETYGALYNWQAVNDSRNLAPEGWHVPTDEEWQELADYLGGSSVAGKKLKTTSGWSNNGNGIDEVGFGAFPGGYRNYGGFYEMRGTAYFWSSSEGSSYDAWGRLLNGSDNGIGRLYWDKTWGFSVRCVRD